MNYKDVEMLNESMRYMGNSFANSRQRNIENAQRTRALDTADRRTDVEDKRYTDAADLADRRLSEGTTEAWLSGEDGGTVMYRGNPQGLQTLQDQAAAKGKPLKLVDRPDKKANIGSFRTVTPLGELTFNLNTPDEVDHVMGLAKQIGGQSKPGFNTAPTFNTEYQSKLEQDVANATTPEAAALAQRKLQIFKSQRPDPEGTETVSEKYPAQDAAPAMPAVPGSHRTILGMTIPGTTVPPQAAVPERVAMPERTVTRKVPTGGQPGPAIPAPMPTVAPQAAGQTLDRATAAAILKEAGGDKNRARAIAQQRGYRF